MRFASRAAGDRRHRPTSPPLVPRPAAARPPLPPTRLPLARRSPGVYPGAAPTPRVREFAADPPVEERVGDALRERDATVAVAESCTGGLIGSLLTDVPGASDYFDRSIVTYAYDAKRQELAVPREALDAEGAVSAPVAEAMAAAVRDTADATFGLATTGVAGPGGGTPDTPVGTVYVAVAYAAPWGTEASYARSERHEFDGDRLAVKERAARTALATLLSAAEAVDDGDSDAADSDPDADGDGAGAEG